MRNPAPSSSSLGSAFLTAPSSCCSAVMAAPTARFLHTPCPHQHALATSMQCRIALSGFQIPPGATVPSVEGSIATLAKSEWHGNGGGRRVSAVPALLHPDSHFSIVRAHCYLSELSRSCPPGSVRPNQEVLPNLCTELLNLPDLGPKSILLAVLALQPGAKGSQKGCEARL